MTLAFPYLSTRKVAPVRGRLSGALWRSPRGRAAVSLFALVGFLLSVAAAASASLHHWLHEDSGSPQHQCLATLLPEGKAQTSSAAASVPPPTVGVEIHLLPAFPAFAFPLPCLPVGRGPPSL